MRTIILGLADESESQLVDELGNELIASFSVTDYELSAEKTVYLLHGYESAGVYADAFMKFNLVDEDDNQLVDELGNELIARMNIFTRLIHAEETKRILHGG